MTEQRAFAAAKYWAGHWYWPAPRHQLELAGWRIRPVVIRVEDENEGGTHDR